MNTPCPQNCTIAQIIYTIEDQISDEATIALSELVGPNSLEFDMELEGYAERRIAQFHDALYQSITTEMFHHV